jgi:hypothetical protein
VSRLNLYETSDFNLQVDKVTEEAKLFWVRGEQNIAKHMIKKLLKTLEQVKFNVVMMNGVHIIHSLKRRGVVYCFTLVCMSLCVCVCNKFT